MAKINFEIRKSIEKELKNRKTYREISTLTGLSKSAIGYEIKQYSNAGNIYNAEYANWASQQRSKKRNENRFKHFNKELLETIDKEIKKRKSPIDISFYLKNKYPNKKYMHASHETIYKFVYFFKRYKYHIYADWYSYLPKKRSKRLNRRKLRQFKKRSIPRKIHRMRPEKRKVFGVWEVDIMYLKQGFVFVAVETVSKKIMTQLVYDLRAETITYAVQYLFSRVKNISAVICDRGSENSDFKNWQRILNAVVYCCDPGKPYQKGLVENSNNILRKYLPRNTDARKLTNKDVYKYADLVNSIHRVSLNGDTAKQVYTRLEK